VVEAQMAAFTQLKADTAILPTLKQPDFSKPFEIHTDAASKKGIAVVLCQRVEDTPYPLSFASRSLSPAEQNYSVQEIEALAIVWGIKKFRPFLEYGHFTVLADHSSLQWLLKTKEEKQGRLARWASELQGFSFVVKHIPGKSNFVPDMLSRNSIPTVSAMKSADANIDWAVEQANVSFITDPYDATYIQNGIFTQSELQEIKDYNAVQWIPYRRMLLTI
jgi:hypothetical protein